MSTAHVSSIRPQAAEMPFNTSELSLRTLFTEALAPLRLAAARKKLRLESFVAPDVPDALVGDAEGLRQILAHVVENAIKFTDAGGISVRVHRETVADGKVRLRFSVSDTGVGIPLNRQKNIFLGHGLAVAAHLVEQMGGQIAVESQMAKGSSFRFTVQLLLASDGGPAHRRRAAPLAVSPAPGPGRPLRILLADDSRFNVLFTQALLGKQGHTVAVAGSGREVLDAIKRQKFDLIVMDVQMPEMDGLQATALIRESERSLGGHVPILAMTGNATKQDQELCIRAGMDGYIAKPVQADALLRAVSSLTQSGPVAAFAPPQPGVQIDREALFEEVGGDAELLRRLAKIFDHEVERRLGELRDAVAADDTAAVSAAAHALKGMTSYWCKGKAFEAARQLEENARQGGPADASAAESLSREIAVLQSEIAQILKREAP